MAPAAGRVIARIGPMLGMLPDIANMPQINAQLAIPLQPARPPSGVRSPPVAATPRPTPPPMPPVASGPRRPGTTPPSAQVQPQNTRPAEPRPNGAPMPALAPPVAPAPPAPGRTPTRDLRHEAVNMPTVPVIPAQYVGSALAPARNANR